MSIIRLSSNLRGNILNTTGGNDGRLGMFKVGGSGTNPSLFNTGQLVRIFVMAGSVPTDADTLGDLDTFRTGDRLIEWQITNGNDAIATVDGTDGETRKPFGILEATFLVTASQSGTATWLWWTRRQNTTATATDTGTTSPRNLNDQSLDMIMTVGGPGSGLEVEFFTTSIVAGTSYRMQDIVLKMPESFGP